VAFRLATGASGSTSKRFSSRLNAEARLKMHRNAGKKTQEQRPGAVKGLKLELFSAILELAKYGVSPHRAICFLSHTTPQGLLGQAAA
jgi:hypothetical protein